MPRPPEVTPRGSVERSRALFAELARRSGGTSPTLRAMEDVLFERYAIDCDRFGDVLEPSLSAVGDEVSGYRFSYGFPTFRRQPRSVAETVVRMAGSVGDAAVAASRRVLRAAQRPCVAQPIVGYADDGGGRCRFKLYLLFTPGLDGAARALVREVLGASREPTQAGEMHMLGLDVGPGGVTGAKLYFEHAALEAPGDIAPHGAGGLRSALAIHAIVAPDDASAEPVAVDFSLPENDLDWSAVSASLAKAHPAAVRTVAELQERFPLRVRRLSCFRAPRRLNVYYVLD
jgi:hypothetical protein